MLMPSIFNTNLFDDFFDFPFYDDTKAEKKFYGHHAANLMKTDIQEHEDGYTLEMDLPGFKKEEIKVELNNGYMTISAAKGLDEDEKDKNRVIASTVNVSPVPPALDFYVGEDVTEEDIKAEFKHGILKLFVPKKEAKPAVEQKKYVSIEG